MLFVKSRQVDNFSESNFRGGNFITKIWNDFLGKETTHPSHQPPVVNNKEYLAKICYKKRTPHFCGACLSKSKVCNRF